MIGVKNIPLENLINFVKMKALIDNSRLVTLLNKMEFQKEKSNRSEYGQINVEGERVAEFFLG